MNRYCCVEYNLNFEAGGEPVNAAKIDEVLSYPSYKSTKSYVASVENCRNVTATT
jgi:hypothetical protein